METASRFSRFPFASPPPQIYLDNALPFMLEYPLLRGSSFLRKVNMLAARRLALRPLYP
jgi:hypothetical protein